MIYTDSWLIFKGIKSTNYGIIVERQPDIIRAERRVTELNVPGRSGTLFYDESCFENITKTAECFITDAAYMDAAAAWLTGAGEVIFSNEKSRKYDAFIKNSVAFTQGMGRVFKRFILQFECLPFKRSVDAEQDKITFEGGAGTGFFRGRGTWSAEPVITVYGSGNITININGEAISLKDIDGFITLNSGIKDCYKGVENRNSKMFGEFPLLSPEANTVSWSGNVEKMEIVPDWRWL